MWEHPATQANLALLEARGASVVGPEHGELAEGHVGAGRMAEPEEIVARAEALLAGSTADGALSGRHVLVTAGGTREPLDSVRFLGNRSSGRMGVALADEARARGARVTLLAANLQVPPPRASRSCATPTAADLRREALARSDADVVLMAAAVADYRPAEVHDGKRPKDAETWTIDLVPTTDVARALGAARRQGQVLVAFGAESGEDGLARKRPMLTDKNVDLVVYNDVGRDDIGFDSPDNEVMLVSRGGERAVAKASKPAIARAILDEVERLLERRRERARRGPSDGSRGRGGRRARGARRREPRLGRARVRRDAPAAAALPARRGARARRGRARCREDGAREGARPLARPHVPSRSSSRPTCSRRTSRA